MKQGCPGVPTDLPVGDPALLMPLFYDPRDTLQPSVDLCMIPHVHDYSASPATKRHMHRLGIVQEYERAFPFYGYVTSKVQVKTGGTIRVTALDIRNTEPRAFIDHLVQCRFVVSSSLHGIILAEAYGVQWQRVTFARKRKRNQEGDLKYNDFGLSLGISEKEIQSKLLVTANTTFYDMLKLRRLKFQRTTALYDPLKLLRACPFCDPYVVDRLTKSHL